MAREHDPSNEIPSSPSGPSAGASGKFGNSPVSVRRAVTMRGAAGDPGGALTPRGRTNAPPPSSPSSEAEGADEATTGTDEAGAGTVTGASVPSATTAASPEPAESEESAEPSASTSAASAPETGTPPAVRTVGAVPDAPDAPDAAVAAGAAGNGGAGANAHADGEPPSSRPKKPMLAAAAIAGAILIAVPFLVAGQNDREPERTRTQNAAGTVLGSERSAVPDTYTSESPTPSVKPSKKVKEKEKQVLPPAPQQTLTPSPSTSEKPKPKTEPKPKFKTKSKPKELTGAEKLRRWANGRSGVQNTVIKNASTSQCVDIANYGKGKPTAPVNQYPCNATTADNQLWSLDIVHKSGGPQNAPVFLIRNTKDGLCLDVDYNDARPAGSKVSEFNCRPTGDNQLWWLDPRGDGTNWIRNVVSNDLCLRPTGGASAGNDARLEIAPCGADDHWIV
ncbi:RICIN domain-containing protein [Streptomyces sp. ITFR-6]|uniref:RICIN domain-containing protein n=1 Tax=Streptomyces sp. ITFR-6 TaxID=3075197 RepID=UPI00288A5419|nr:RICIN domain-containing protein [Streptomyces sp. ITFR-6]WNI30437.1 RICIN domain-containing protein [Streptomyces sp. ITFR-6]